MKQITTYFVLILLFISSLLQAQEPNIILIIADDMGWSQTSTGLTNLNNQSDFYETPMLATLASEGIAFPHGYVNGGNCAPTRAAILSGQYAARPTNNVFNVYDLNRGNNSGNSTLIGPDMGLASNGNIDEIPASAITIAESMKVEGYATAHFGKYHMGENENSNVSNNAATDQGFDKNYGGGTKGTPGAYHAYQNAGNWRWNSAIWGNDLDTYAEPYTTAESNILVGDNSLDGITKHVTDAITLAALDFMNANNTDPFFLHFSNFAVHGPTGTQHARPDLLTKYQAKHASTPSSMGHTNIGLAAILEGMDQSIGVLVNYLKTTADPRNPGHMLSDNTLIYFVSDNGGAQNTQENGPLRGMKGEYYEGGIRSVTVAWSDPAGGLLANAGTINSTPVIGFDLYPTFVEAAGGTLPMGYDIDGESLWQMLTNGTAVTRESLFWHFPGYLIDSKRAQRPVTVIRKGNYKLHHFYESAEYELYDIINDISETTNLLPSTDQAVIDIANDMIDDMIDHLNDTSAPRPTFRTGGATAPMPANISVSSLSNSTDGCQAESGYEAYWDFDAASNTDDASGNGNNPLSTTGTIAYDPVDFQEGDRSIIFNGSTEIEYSNNTGTFLTDATNARSISVWIKPTALSGTQEIFEEGGGGNGLALRLNGSNLEASLSNNQGANADPNHTISTSYPIDGDWHHVALVFNGTSSEMLLYIDGVLENTTTGSYTTLASHTSPGGIGGVITGDAFGSGTNDSFFTGKMDALAVYNSVLSETEIQNSACYIAPPGSCVSTAKNDFEAFWDFDIANNANDASGNNQDPRVALSSGITFDSTDFMEGDQSIVFDGSEAIQYATNNNTPDNFLNATANSRTIAVWIKPTSLSGNQNIFDEGGNNKGIAVRLSGNNLESVIRDTNANASLISSVFPNDGEWHHIAMVYSGGSTSHKLYIDGSEVASEVGAGVPSTVPSNASYGGVGGRLSGKDSFQNDLDVFFTGKMDAFAVSNSALSIEQILSLSTVWYADTDGDGYGDANSSEIGCSSSLTNATQDNTDCDDNDSDEYPGQTWYIDADGDDYGVSSVSACERPTNGFLLSELSGTGTDDCDDNDSDEYPGQTWYLDADSDGYSEGTSTTACEQPTNYYLASDLAATSGDCVDNNANINPGESEVLNNGIDDDCNPLTMDNGSLSNDEFSINNILLVPNPFNDKISIELHSNSGNTNFEILLIDINGRIVYKRIKSSVNNKIVLTDGLSKLSNGVYFIKLTNKVSGLNTVKKLIKY